MTIFSDVLDSAGIPKNLDDAKKQIQDELKKQNSELSNVVGNSPSLILLTALISKPILDIRKKLEDEVIPGMFIKTAKGSYLDLLAFQRKITRIQASKTRGKITFTRSDASGALLIPKDTEVASTTINGKIYKLKTLANATITDGNTAIDVECEALENGTAYNLAVGYYSVLFSGISGISSVSNQKNWLVKAGTDLEDDENLRKRIRNKVLDSASWQLTESYKNIIINQTAAPYELIFFNLNKPRGDGSANGYAILESGDLSDSIINKCNDFINKEGNHGLGDDFQFLKMPTKNYKIVINAKIKENQNTIKQKINDFVKCVFRQNSEFSPSQKATPNSTLYFSLISADLHKLHKEIQSIEFKNDKNQRLDYIASALEMPKLQTLTINVS